MFFRVKYKTKKEWINEGEKNLPPRGAFKLRGWGDWLHLLNELPNEYVIRNRRNLLACSVIAILASSDTVDMSNAKVFGVELSSNDQTIIFGGLLLGLIYFLIMYLVVLIGDHIDKSMARFQFHLSDYWKKNAEDEELERKAQFLVREEIRRDKDRQHLIGPIDSYMTIETLVSCKLRELENEEITAQQRSEKQEWLQECEKSIKKRQQYVWIKILFIHLLPVIFALYALASIWGRGISSLT
jgi:hypothetical protein